MRLAGADAARRRRWCARRAARPDARFCLGLLTGAVYFAGTLYWLVETMTTFGGLPTAGAVVAAGLLVAYLSLFPAAFASSLGRLHARFGPRALLLAPSIWVATELGRQYVWDGFPWALLGYSQVTMLPIAQLASIVGRLRSLGLARAGFDRRGASSDRRIAGAGAMARGSDRRAGALSGIWAWGAAAARRGAAQRAATPVRVAVLQGNIAQDEKWNPANREAITAAISR